MESDYELIPMSEITYEARKIAVAWMECEDKDWIGQKHKLASDIMNYAKKFARQQQAEIQFPTDKEIEEKASGIANLESKKDFARGEWLGVKEGAKWMKEQVIKRNQ